MHVLMQLANSKIMHLHLLPAPKTFELLPYLESSYSEFCIKNYITSLQKVGIEQFMYISPTVDQLLTIIPLKLK